MVWRLVIFDTINLSSKWVILMMKIEIGCRLEIILFGKLGVR